MTFLAETQVRHSTVLHFSRRRSFLGAQDDAGEPIDPRRGAHQTHVSWFIVFPAPLVGRSHSSQLIDPPTGSATESYLQANATEMGEAAIY